MNQDHYEQLLERKDQQIKQLEEKNATLLAAVFKKEKENAEIKRKFLEIQKLFLKNQNERIE